MSSFGRRGVGEAASFARAAATLYRESEVPFMAGSVAYSAFVSLLPLVLLGLLVGSALGGERLSDYVLGVAGAYLTTAGRQLVTDAITRAAGQTELSVFTAVVLVWGVLKVFRSLDTAFSTLYGSRRDDGLIDRFRDAVIVLGALGVALAALVAAGAALALFPDVPYLRVLNPLLLTVGLTVALLPVFYVFPDVDVSVGEVLPGTVIAAVGWTALEALFGVYVAVASTAELYGSIGAVVLLITFLYFGALVLLAGAVANVVLAGRTPHR